MVNKKGQAAMEFLMTYGWAILVVLIAIGALAYFGVLNPGRYLPSSCTISNQIGCNEFKVTGGAAANTVAITLVLQNGRGTDLTLSPAFFAQTNINLTSPTNINCALSTLNIGSAVNTTNNMTDGASATATFLCPSAMPPAGQKVKGTINIAYIDAGSNLGVRFASGTITTKAE